MKRALASFIIIAILIGVISTYAEEQQAEITREVTEEAQVIFTDVVEKNWFFTDVMTLTHKGIISGVTPLKNNVGNYNPNGTVSLGEFLAIATRLVARDKIKDTPNAAHWATKNYLAALELGLLEGLNYEKDVSAEVLNAPISRENMAYILVAVARLNGETLHTMPDIQNNIRDYDKIGQKYRLPVLQAYSNGLLVGDSNGNFNAKASLTRAEVASVFCRLMGYTSRPKVEVSLAVSENIGVETRIFTIDGVKKNVNVVTIDLNSPDIELEVVTAHDKVGGAESFQSMINRKKPAAAINANFFDAYTTLEPFGSIMKNKELTYLEGTNTSFLIKDKKTVDMEIFSTRIKAYLDGNRENKWNTMTNSMDFFVFEIWYVNSKPLDATGVYLYTPHRGDSIELKGGTAIVVRENKVMEVVNNPNKITIPKDGFIIYYAINSIGADHEKYINNRFKIGRTVEFEYITSVPNYENLDNEDTKTNEVQEVKSSKQTTLYGSIDKKTKNEWNNDKDGMDFYLFTIWYINTKPIDSTGVYLYTPERGESFEVAGGRAITVKNGVITKVNLDAKTITIPEDGYVIYYGKDSVKDEYINARFVVGKTVDFYHSEGDNIIFDTTNIIKKAVKENEAALEEPMGPDTSSTEINLNNAEYMLSAGPYLVKDGKVIVDAKKQGFKEDKITVNRAQRSALGITKDNKLILVTAANLNMNELAKVMVELKCDKAMNLDGGASSGLYANGKMITKPGRNLNTVLMIYN